MKKSPITRSYLANDVGRLLGLSLARDANRLPLKIVNTIFQTIIDALARGEDVTIRGLGTFKVHRRAPAQYNDRFYFDNKKTMVTLPTVHPAENRVKFIPAPSILEAIQNVD